MHRSFVALAFLLDWMVFSKRELRYVCYMRSQFRLSSVCLSSVTLVHPTQLVDIFCIFFTIR